MGAAFSAILSILGIIAPLLSNSSKISEIIKALSDLIPVIMKEFEDLVPIVNNIIVVLKGNSEITPEQWADLTTMEQQLDKNFDDAAQDADKEDNPSQSTE
jgi:hypothetical protein